ncbi:MAG TPA: glycosyltransferase family 4 protein [Oscillatoriaceae cyanobacterium M33_DOE_052]|uniref:Glycosyltransferase family 1 protein n=1 Tax=Planktothricoides sp. SpSt-374 TaxID=2282167 RepID=A0A7C3VI96_9CYAN|nr:glycosyltransferase family 4 protein [Oscillatoriaceae cyanobacterium M33_DOE_052]
MAGLKRDTFIFLEIFSLEGGIQSYVRDILQAYVSTVAAGKTRGADVFLLRDGPECENHLALFPSLKFFYLKTQWAALGRLRLTFSLFWYFLRHRPQRVFCGHINLAPLVRLLCYPFGITYIVLTYGKEVWEPLPRPYQKALRQAAQIWTISRYSRDRACVSNRLDPQKFQILPCAVDGDTFQPGEKSPELLQRYGLADAKVLMTVARLWSGDIYKGVDVTIRAISIIAQSFPNVKYLVIGRGDDQPRLQALAAAEGMVDRVVFAGFVPTPDLPAHFHLADAYIMPSQEGFGIVYLEAMACGVPVLAGDADGSAEPLQDGKLGWQVPHRNPEAVAAACIEILQGSDRRCDGKWLREMTLANFGIAAFTARLEQLLDVRG